MRALNAIRSYPLSVKRSVPLFVHLGSADYNVTDARLVPTCINGRKGVPILDWLSGKNCTSRQSSLFPKIFKLSKPELCSNMCDVLGVAILAFRAEYSLDSTIVAYMSAGKCLSLRSRQNNYSKVVFKLNNSFLPYQIVFCSRTGCCERSAYENQMLQIAPLVTAADEVWVANVRLDYKPKHYDFQANHRPVKYCCIFYFSGGDLMNRVFIVRFNECALAQTRCPRLVSYLMVGP